MGDGPENPSETFSSEAEMNHLYPNAPGFQDRETSAAAAVAIAPKAKTMREKVLALIAGQTNATADEAAEALGISILSARPRCAELSVMGIIVDSGVRRENASGKSAIAWRIAERQMNLF